MTLDRLRQHPEIARLLERIGSHTPVEVDEPGVRRAAVALILRLAPETTEPEILFIQRAHYETDPWSGQVAFPGGREEPGDESLARTAIR
ncbi:MAG TPA: NUDIX domain-containing protein, partial [Gemmatimonadaceae bacterium]|nr:NUDIX domain-containing protein [Gemmatimonadaceae bacterium]